MLDRLKITKNRRMDHCRSFYLVVIILAIAGMQAHAQGGDPKLQIITIRAIAGMQYDKVRFQVAPGSEVKVIFKNTDDIDHNLLITEPGGREEVVEAALELGVKGPEKDFIPPDTGVLWSTQVLSPGESDSVRFSAPDREGVYPYVCTFPGHGSIMYGAMYVSTDKRMPPLKEDRNIPPGRRSSEAESKEVLRPYNTENPPYLYRTSMPDSGPASIAVHLPDSVS